MRGGRRFKSKRVRVKGGKQKSPTPGKEAGFEGLITRLILGLLLGWDAEEFAGVGALHFGSDGEAGDVDELVFLSVGAVDEARATGDWGTERELSSGCCGDGGRSGLGFCGSRSEFGRGLGRRRGGSGDFWGLDKFGLGDWGWSGDWFWLGFGGRGYLRGGGFWRWCWSRCGGDFGSNQNGVDASDGWSGRGLRLDDWGGALFWLQFGLGLGHHLRARQDGCGPECWARYDELTLGVGTDDFGAWVHAAHVNETWGIGEGGANVTAEAGDGIGWRQGGALLRDDFSASEVGLCWGDDTLVGVV